MDANANTIWYEDTYVKSSETDFQKHLKPSGFFRIMQDAASNHASHLGFGYNDLMKREIGWVLTRKKVVFYHFPEMDEPIRVQTWPKGIQQRLFFMRDHHVFGADGSKLAASTSAYVLISARARRMLPPNALDTPLPDNGGLSALDEPLEKIAPAADLSECFTRLAAYSDVDIMGHVTNSRYIDWISDCFSMEEYQAQRLNWLQINYLNEVKPGEKITLLRAQRPQDSYSWYITGLNNTNNTKAFDAELHWEDNGTD